MPTKRTISRAHARRQNTDNGGSYDTTTLEWRKLWQNGASLELEGSHKVRKVRRNLVGSEAQMSEDMV
ncbi:hypothetical protein VNO78_30444 [Psophocarpus tetragonolobus]|uniref:Uncharacterized protein n=1 Tax=Psophocarpus tetragonolobus TaxID=3891 RepID=A0AAN9RWK3_PSOTE